MIPDTLIRRYLRDIAIQSGSHSRLIGLAISSDTELEQQLIDTHARLDAEAVRQHNLHIHMGWFKRRLSRWLGWV